MATPVEDLAKQGESGLKTRQAGRDLTSRKTKTISKKAIQAVQGAWSVNVVSSVYHKISQEHFSPMLEKVGSFTGLDDLNDGQRARLGQELDNMSQSASDGIDAIVEEYRKGIDEEFAKFTEEVKAIKVE
eukprot:08711.XXX_492783_492036_1 [CDS] Oithona nana genome sequencing.